MPTPYDDLPWRRRRKLEQDAEQALQDRVREAERENRRERRERVSLYASLAATVLAALSLFVWLSEAPDRARDREIDRNSIVQHAKDVVTSYSARDVVEVSPDLLAAMAILAREREWIELSAGKEIRFWDVRLPCGGYILRAPSIEFNKVDLNQTHIIADPENLVVFGGSLFLTTLEIDDSLTLNQPMQMSLFETAMISSHLNTSSAILAVHNLSLKDSTIKVGSGDFWPDVAVEFSNYKIARTFIWPDAIQKDGFADDPERREELDPFFATAPEAAPEHYTEKLDAWKSKQLQVRAPLAPAHVKKCVVSDANTYTCNASNVEIDFHLSDDGNDAPKCPRPYPLDRRRYR